MSDKTLTTSSGKILFGIDYFNIMLLMEVPDEGKTASEKGPIIGAVMRFFLLQWGFSVEEIDKAWNLFWEKSEKNELDPKVDTVLGRLCNFVKDDREAQERLLLQIAALGQLDKSVSEGEKYYANFFKEQFDFKPSEFNALVQQGYEWCLALDFLGNQYIEYAKTHKEI